MTEVEELLKDKDIDMQMNKLDPNRPTLDYALEVRDLSKSYGSHKAVSGVSFRVKPGEVFGLLGPNGAGKTTTMRMMSGVLPPSSGEMRVLGIDVVKRPRDVRRVMGVVTQFDGLDDAVDVHTNLVSFGHLCGMSWKHAKDRADQVLRFMDLDRRASDSIWTLSGGMKRRLAVARVLMPSPQVIIMDEPTTGLDPNSRNKLWEQLRSMRRAGTTILMSTHYMEEAYALCNRIMIIDNGVSLVEGSPSELVSQYVGHTLAELTLSDEKAAVSTRLHLKEKAFKFFGGGSTLKVPLNGNREPPSGMSGVSMSVRPANLEDVFMVLTGKELEEE